MRFIIAAVFSYVLVRLYTSFSIYESLSIALFLYVILSFIDNLGKKLVILDIVILTTLVVCLLMPIAGYHFFNHANRMAKMWFWYMRVPSEEYYSYMFPATILMIAGLKLPLFFQKQTYKNQLQYMSNVKAYLSDMKWEGFIIVAIGLAASLIQSFVPLGLATLFSFMKNLMFVGVFYCLYSSFPNKRIILIFVFGLLFLRAISAGMFGELVFMVIMSVILIFLGNKMNFITKFSMLIIGIFSIILLQAVKPAFREQTWGATVEGSKLGIFTDMLSEKIANPSTLLENETVLFAFYMRFNEGQIISRVINKVPERLPYANGETIFLSIASTLVPRFLWPNKPEAGGAYNFERFVGIKLRGYSIGISPFGEAYGNFGKTGGIIFMFFFGLLFNFLFQLMLKFAVKTPSLILWFPFLFFYAVKIETDVVSMLNSIIKGAIFAYLTYRIFPIVFKRHI